MKLSQVLNESSSSKTLEELISRLEKLGGKVYTQIKHGDQTGWMGTNGSGKSKVYFAFYPDGTSQRFESLPADKDLKAGWKASDLRDPETILADKNKTDKLKKARAKEALFDEEIHITQKELEALCKANHISIGKIADFYPDGRHAHSYKEIDGRAVATVQFTVITKNEDYTKDGDNGEELHDPVYIDVWRDSKNPEKLHASDESN
jgi:hypothetical protein